MSAMMDLMTYAVIAVFAQNLIFTSGVGAERSLRIQRSPKRIAVSALAVMVFLALVSNTTAGMVYAMIYGIFSSLALPLETIMLSLIATDLFGNKSFDKILGIIAALNTLGYAVGAPLMNFCYDAFGTYVPFIWVCVGIMAVVTIVYQFVITSADKERKAILAAQEQQ